MMADQFHHTNLQGADFRGKNLTGANFSYADIRGANFSHTILIGANFSHSQAGLPTAWTLGLVTLSLILSLFAGLIAAYSSAFIGDLLNNTPDGSSLFGFICLSTLTLLLIIIIWQGLGTILAILIEIVAACLMAALAFFPDSQTGLLIGAEFTVLALAGSMAGVGNMAVAVALGSIIPLPKTRVVTGFLGLIGAVLGVLLGVREAAAFPIAGFVGLILITSGIYVGIQAITRDKKYKIIRSLAIAMVTKGGTTFRHANLTDADFTQATLKSIDFRNAILTRTCWYQAQNLNQARLEETYLDDPRVRQLAITKDGQHQNFDRLNLQDLNLQKANLQSASFINTDLSKATLQNANLKGAKLVQTQLYKTILTAACLTGACIENWGISTNTRLDSVKCEYVYMRLPTEDDPDPWRKPDKRNQTFKEGDFTDFITPIIKTLDLYQTQDIDMRQVAKRFKTIDLFHYDGIDPTAAAIAVTQLADNHPDAELVIVALEGRSHEKIRLQAKVTSDTNRSQLYSEYFEKYTEIKSLAYPDLQALLLGIQAKDERIQSLEKLLENAIQQPKFYVETYQNTGEFSMSQSKGNISISGTQGSVSGVAGAGENLAMTGVAIGEISGNVTNTINQLPDSSEPEKPGIKELLTELQAAIETDPNLSDEDKAEALEQLQAIAEAGKKPQDGTMQKIAKNAMKFLKGTIADLPSTVQLVQTCAKLLPLITNFFSLP